MNEKIITMVADEAVRLMKENPGWKYKQAIEKAKGMILNENTSMDKTKKAN